MYGGNSYANHTYGGNTNMPVTIFFYEHLTLADKKHVGLTFIENLLLTEKDFAKHVSRNWQKVEPSSANWRKIKPDDAE